MAEAASAVANSHSHSISSRIGLNLFNNRISPYGGIRGTWQNSEVKTHFSQVVSELGEVTSDISQKVERDTVEGIAGVDAHVWGPFFGRLETTFNDSDVSIQFKIIYGIGFVHP